MPRGKTRSGTRDTLRTVKHVKKAQQPACNIDAKPWTSHDIRTLKALAGTVNVASLARTLGRSISSVRAAANRHRISLRQPGSTSGLLLGQPRGVSLRDTRTLGHTVTQLQAMRTAALNGDVDLEQLEQRLADQRALARGATPCPRCTIRPQRRDHGICDVCHIKQLAKAHADLAHIDAAERDYWAKKKAAQRAGLTLTPDTPDARTSSPATAFTQPVAL